MNRALWLSLVGWLWAAAAPASFGAEHDFGKWEKEIAAYEQADRTNPPPPNAILFVGSSTIRLWKTLARDFPEQAVINRGVGGCEIVDCTRFADRIVFPYQPRMIFIRCGGNDLWAGKSPEQVFADYQEFVANVHAKMPAVEIMFISLNPSLARWKQADQEKSVNSMVAEYTKRTPHLKYLEAYDLVLGPDGKPRPELFVADKLHFNAEGYKLLAERVRAFLPK